MTLQAHYTDKTCASLSMNIYTHMFTVKAVKNGEMVKKTFDDYQKAVKFYQNQISTTQKHER